MLQEVSTEDEVDVPQLLQDPRSALFPMLVKVRGWEEVRWPMLQGVSLNTVRCLS